MSVSTGKLDGGETGVCAICQTNHQEPQDHPFNDGATLQDERSYYSELLGKPIGWNRAATPKPEGDALYAEGLSREEQMAEILRHALHCGYLPQMSADEAKRALARKVEPEGDASTKPEVKIKSGGSHVG